MNRVGLGWGCSTLDPTRNSKPDSSLSGPHPRNHPSCPPFRGLGAQPPSPPSTHLAGLPAHAHSQNLGEESEVRGGRERQGEGEELGPGRAHLASAV